MTSPSNILVFGEGSFTKQLINFYSHDNSFDILGNTLSVIQARGVADKKKKLIIVIDVDKNTSLLLDDLFDSLRSSNVRYLAICKDINQGFELLGKGASEMCVKPKDDLESTQRSFHINLTAKTRKIIKEYDVADKTLKKKFNASVHHIIAIGSSTGGTECILQILKDLPENAPPVLVVQHMPPVFTKLYSNRLNSECKISVWEAGNGDKLENGLALIAPGDMHMSLAKNDGGYYVKCQKGEPYSGHIPSADYMFESVAKVAGKISIGVILTGMGKDGAKGLLKMRQNGAYTIGQDKQSCIVYGMPKAAYEMGAVMKQTNPEAMANLILEQVNKRGLNPRKGF